MYQLQQFSLLSSLKNDPKQGNQFNTKGSTMLHALKLNTLIKISKRGIDFYCLQHEQKQRENENSFPIKS